MSTITDTVFPDVHTTLPSEQAHTRHTQSTPSFCCLHMFEQAMPYKQILIESDVNLAYQQGHRACHAGEVSRGTADDSKQRAWEHGMESAAVMDVNTADQMARQCISEVSREA